MSPRVKDLSDVIVQVLGAGPRTRSFGDQVLAETGDARTADQHGGGELDGGLLLLSRFIAEVDDPNLDYLLTITIAAHRRKLAAEQVTIAQREPGLPVTSTGLRAVSLDAYIGRVRQVLGASYGGMHVVNVVDRTESDVKWGLVSRQKWQYFDQEQRRRHPPAETLPKVAEVYRAALADPDPAIARSPTTEVSIRLHYSRGHAARLVTQARRAGLLGPANPGRAGEASTPLTATNTAKSTPAKGTTKRRTK